MDNFIFTFFNSISGYISFNQILFITVGLFLFAMFVVIFTTANSYEAKLIRSIDMFNNYFNNNPQLTEDNLLQFNAMMKQSKVPHLLCKQWQQFVLYREQKASTYLSYEICVNSPLKNSSYKRDIKVLNWVAYFIAIFSFLINVFCAYELDIVSVFQYVFLGPAIVLLLNWLLTIILNVKYNAIVNDINQNFQYFQSNMDKATQTIPEYVDYEVLFDKNEIKRGIPILYAYLQKRAADEKRELERARLKNVEHEKFNFDESGVESSLVLERAMQEAENYIAERKKYLEDSAQVNNEINQEELNYREITKEYQRQMQVSKESFDNFKDQLNEVSSTIEANYLKKQQQQELDRQRNLERDYDAATERHKKAIEGLQKELSDLEKMIADSRAGLEKAMMSEFGSYSSKVYNAAHKLASYREQAKIDDLKKEIKVLEEKIVYLKKHPNDDDDDNGNTVDNQFEAYNAEEQDDIDTKAEESKELLEVNSDQKDKDLFEVNTKQEDKDLLEVNAEQNNANTNEGETTTWEFDDDDEQEESTAKNAVDEGWTFNYDDEQSEQTVSEVNTQGEPADTDEKTETAEETENKPKRSAGRPRKVLSPEEINKPKRPRGRPKKEQDPDEVNKPKRPRGRPKKQEAESVKTIIITEQPVTSTKTHGRPKKAANAAVETETTTQQTEPKKTRGRPRKVIIIEEAAEPKPKGKRGRPKKVTVIPVSDGENAKNLESVNDIDEYLKAIDDQIAEENLKIEQTQKELEKNTKIRRRKK